MANITMQAKDSISAKLAKCYVTIGSNRYNAFNMINMEAKFEKNKTEVPILGQTGVGNKSTGWKGTGSATMHYNTSIYRRMMLDFKNTTSDAKRQTVILKGCNIDGGILAKFDASSDDPLDEDVDFTYEDFEMPEEFNLLNGMV